MGKNDEEDTENQKVRGLDPPARPKAQFAYRVVQRPVIWSNGALDEEYDQEQHRPDGAGKSGSPNDHTVAPA